MIWSIQIRTELPGDIDQVIADLWELGTAGVQETEDGLFAYFDETADQAAVESHFAGRTVVIETNLPAVSVEEANDRDPILVGTRFVVVPRERIVLPIDAAMAFGSGRHETTQLCLEALERLFKPGDTVFDVGCGSGILSLAAEKLGAARVIAADIDEAGIAVTRRHFSGPVFVGSADGFCAEAADIVLSNITGKANDHIASDLRRICKAGGRIVVSGFTSANAPIRFQAEEILAGGEWQCWICKRDCVDEAGQAGDPNSHPAQWWL